MHGGGSFLCTADTPFAHHTGPVWPDRFGFRADLAVPCLHSETRAMTDARHDVIVIGSGCTGGTAAWQLTRCGLRVLLLEAGDHVTPTQAKPDGRLSTNIGRAWRAVVSRSQHMQSQHPGFWVYPPSLFVNDRHHPYSNAPGRSFVWIRGRQVGGRSLTWGGLALRLSPYEMQGWPITYDELAPYYDQVESVMQVLGASDGVPQLPNGQYAECQPFTAAELAFKDRIAARWPERRVLIGRGVDQRLRDGWSTKTSQGSTLADAMKTGLLDVQPNSVVRKLLVDDATGMVSGIEVADAITRSIRTIPARAVVVCASTLESVRLLLNSRSAACPDGVGNASGVLGRYILNHMSRSITFEIPVDQASDVQPFTAAGSIIIPRYENLDRKTMAFEGGFGAWGCIQREFLPPEIMAGSPRSAFGFLVGYGECLPDADNRVELDPTVVDAWGVPTLRFDVRWLENDERMGAHIEQDLREMVTAAGGTPMPAAAPPGPIRYLVNRVMKAGESPGAFVHEVGGARMGSSPADSVVNGWCQVWDSPNVLVTDGACWPTAGWQNPTLTEMAITARSCAFLADRIRDGRL